MLEARTRSVRIVAQDPSVKRPDGRILTTRVRVPWEPLEAGPAGHRVHVVDYDASSQTLYAPDEIGDEDADGRGTTPRSWGSPGSTRSNSTPS